jgi:signal transduction histidine kinase/FixJ family two-component response regulator
VEVALSGGESADIEFEREKPGHETLWLSLQISPVYKSSGEIMLYVGILTDVTAVKVREAHYFQVQRLEALGQLAGGVAHDFNNLLSIVDGYSRLAQKACSGCSGGHTMEYLERVRAAVQRGASLTGRLLTFGKSRPSKEAPMEIGALLRDHLSLLRPLVDEDIALDVLVTSKPCYVKCSANAIGNILMNLVLNAKDAMPSGGRISVSVELCGRERLPPLLQECAETDYLHLCVTDTGEGIPKDKIEKIFDPFYSTKEAGKGTGLGLSMVYGLVKEMGGHVEVASEENKGTAMSIFLPAVHSELSNELDKGAGGAPPSLRFDGYTALVVEDEPDLLLLVSSMLEGYGMHVLRAANGNEALVVQDDYDGDIQLLLTDVIMPELNGIKLNELIGSLRPEIQTIFMSGYPSAGELARYSLPDDAMLMTKPIDERELVALIYRLIAHEGVLPPVRTEEGEKEKTFREEL